MKKLILTIATLSVISFGASAFAGNGHGEKSQRSMGKLFKDSELALTEEQIASIKEIRKEHKAQRSDKEDRVRISDLDESAADYQEQVDALKAERAERRAAAQEEQEIMQSKISALLTPVQQTRFETLVAEFKAKKAEKKAKMKAHKEK